MRTGQLDRNITIQTITNTVSSGDVTQVLSTGVTVRANVKQIDGSRYMNIEELVDKQVYEIVLWDNGYGHNLKITYGSLTLYPIRVIVNPDPSTRDVMTIIAVTKV
jgi:head-tail adaptor